MACGFSERTDEYHGWKCSSTDGACMYFIPDEKACYKEYGEGPLAFRDAESSEQEAVQIKSCRQTVGEYVEELVKRAKGTKY